MASLLPYADAVLQQKLLMSTEQERRAKRLSDLQLAKNRQCLTLPDRLAAVESESEQLHEQQEGKQRLVGELAQFRLELQTRNMCLAGASKKRDAVQNFFTEVETAWMGVPAAIVQVARALQERRVVLQESSPLVAAVNTLRCRVSLVRTVAQHRHCAHAIVSTHGERVTAYMSAVNFQMDRCASVTARLTRQLTETSDRQATTLTDVASDARLLVEVEARVAFAQLCGAALTEWRTALKAVAQAWSDHLSEQTAAMETTKDAYDHALTSRAARVALATEATAHEAALTVQRRDAAQACQQALADAQRDVRLSVDSAHQLDCRGAAALEEVSRAADAFCAALVLDKVCRYTQQHVFSTQLSAVHAAQTALNARVGALRQAHEERLLARQQKRALAEAKHLLMRVEGDEAVQRRSLLQEEATVWMRQNQQQREARAAVLSAQAARALKDAAVGLEVSRKQRTAAAATARRRSGHQTASDHRREGVQATAGSEAPRCARGATAIAPVTTAAGVAALRRSKRAREVVETHDAGDSAPSDGTSGAASQLSRAVLPRDGGAAHGRGEPDASFDSAEDVITVTKQGGTGHHGAVSVASSEPSPSPAPRAPAGASTRARAALCGAVAKLNARSSGVFFDRGPLPTRRDPRQRPRLAHTRAPLAGARPQPSSTGGGALSHALGFGKPSARQTLFGPLRPTVVEKHLSQASSAESGDSIFKDFFSCK